MVNWETIVAPEFWKAFKIPAFAFAVLALLLLMRNVNESLEYIYIQHVANYALGASIISYGHFLFHATWINRKKEPDLPFWVQAIAMTVHVAWFIFFLWTIFLSTR
jgi:hypothetical protein